VHSLHTTKGADRSPVLRAARSRSRCIWRPATDLLAGETGVPIACRQDYGLSRATAILRVTSHIPSIQDKCFWAVQYNWSAMSP
jgi:hypothetical protein